jgi:peptide/nickel transport system ATP-binding protein
LDRPSAGRLLVGGRDLLTLSQGDLTTYRREQIGFVWQQTTRNVLPYLSARENVELLATLAGQSHKDRRAWSNELLNAVGAQEFIHRKPPQLSGGQQQRVAIACALANRPQILLGDEPTGEVDWPTAQLILALLRDLRDRYGLTVVMVTHDPRVAATADRVVAIRDGQVSTEVVGSRSAFEQVVVDQAGRLQIPADQRLSVGIGRRARIEVVDGGLLIRPGDEGTADDAPVIEETEQADLLDLYRDR